jgi:phosphohistidine phosphatase
VPFLLTLLRHAHAEPAHVEGSDFDRLLSRDGRAAARAAAARIGALPTPPDRVIASPARRTRETAEILRECARPGLVVEYLPELYLAPLETLRAIVAAGWRTGHLAIVGHNPGLSELVADLAGEKASAGLAPADAFTFGFDSTRRGDPPQSVVRHRDGMR